MKERKSPELIVSSLYLEHGLKKDAFKRFCFYAKQLQKLKMMDGDISGLISDFYYASIDSFKSSKADKKTKINKKKQIVQVLEVENLWAKYIRRDTGGEYVPSEKILGIGLTAAGKLVGVIDLGDGELDFCERQDCDVSYYGKSK